jgi:hypothetical protein
VGGSNQADLVRGAMEFELRIRHWLGGGGREVSVVLSLLPPHSALDRERKRERTSFASLNLSSSLLSETPWSKSEAYKEKEYLFFLCVFSCSIVRSW